MLYEVITWIDAENTLSIFEDCDLGISATAGKRIGEGVPSTPGTAGGPP